MRAAFFWFRSVMPTAKTEAGPVIQGPPPKVEKPMAAKDGAFRTLSALAAGSVAGVLTIIQSVSFAALIFPGPLSAHIPEGLGIALVTGAIVGLVGTLTSSSWTRT